jgi:hypothetical protein
MFDVFISLTVELWFPLSISFKGNSKPGSPATNKVSLVNALHKGIPTDTQFSIK